MPRIQELAQHLGVSTATVSRALNDKPGVSQETRRRVLAAAKKMHYQPNRSARALSTARTCNVLFLVHRQQFPPTEDPFYPHIMRGIEESLADDGYSMTLVTASDEQLAAGPSGIPMLHESRADGIVVAGPHIPPGFILATQALGLPVLTVDNALRETEIPAVLADNIGGARAATDHLIKTHGYKAICLLRGASGWASNDERAAGYRAAMETSGLQPHVIQVEDTTIATGADALEIALEARPNTEAILAVNDAMAIGAMRTARALGRRLPEDLAVVGFDDISWAALSDPPLSTVAVPTVEMGRVAARVLLEQWKGTLTVASRTTLATRLVIRESCGCTDRRQSAGAVADSFSRR